MISRSDMRRFAQAARNGWNTPIEKRCEAVQQVREVLNSDAPAYVVETALAVMNDLEAAGWIEDANAANLLQ